MVNKPIFYTESGVRWRAFLGGLQSAILFALVALVSLGIALFQPTNAILPHPAAGNEILKRVIQPDKVLTFRTAQNSDYSHLHHNLVQIIKQNKSLFRVRRQTTTTKGKIHGAFFVNWDQQSFGSLKTNIDKINMVFPEWYGIGDSSDTIAGEISRQALDLLRERLIPIVPIFSNYSHRQWKTSNVKRLIGTAQKRRILAQRIDSL
ncbi:MAG: hypothetical protein PHC61_18910, partial [Chitinivibrionales bacterium]|nr:hypothetical protein [Chitinivibrionales bacterium]